MEKKEETYGNITVGFGTPEQRVCEIVDYLRVEAVDKRFVTISGIDQGGILLSVESLPSSGRPPNMMWLSEESATALFSAYQMYLVAKGIDVKESFMKSIGSDKVEYDFSPNLIDPFKDIAKHD